MEAVMDASFDTDSYNTFAEAPWSTKRAMLWFWDAEVLY
jgi:acetyl esterase